MLVLGVAVYVFADRLVGLFSTDAMVLRTGVEYLHIVVLNFVFSGITFVTASMFQAMGNTMPSLITSFVRLVIVLIPAVLLSRVAGFELRWIWYLGVASVAAQMTINLLLLQREFRVRLG